MTKLQVALWILTTVIPTGCTTDSTSKEQSEKPVPVEFSYESGTFAKITLPYRKGIYSFDTKEKPILVIYLHGGSSKGSDNNAPLREKGTDSISNYLIKKHLNAIFLVPQCPSNLSWGGSINNALKELIMSYINNDNANSRRVYAFGGSMGGTGIWSLLSDYPSLLAAAMPVASDPSKCNITAVAQTPVYTVMGTNDAIMDIKTTQYFVEALKNNGDEVYLDIENGWTHEDTCIQSYTTERLDWIFSH